MLIDEQLVEVKIGARNIQHYRDLGYNITQGDIIMVPPSDLTQGSHAEVQLVCDYCGKLIFRKYKDYIRKRMLNNIDACADCYPLKVKDGCKIKYGVENVFQLDEVKNKTKQTWVEKYGCECIQKTDEIKAKVKQTNLRKYQTEWPTQSASIKEKTIQTNYERYGCSNPFQSENIKNKIKQTNLEKYGVENAVLNDEIRNKMFQTNLAKYGVKYPLQNKDIMSKMLLTFSKNGNTPTSSQQIQLFDIIKQKYPNAIINYPYNDCLLDIYICINNVCIDVEYDGWFWHKRQQRDIKRDKYLQSQGFKVLRIRSGHLLPTEEELFSTIDHLVNTEYHFKEIILSDWKENIEKEGEYNGT